MTALLPSVLLAYLSEPRSEAEIYSRFSEHTRSEVLDTLLYLAGRRAVMIEPQSNAKRWVQSIKARAKLNAMNGEAWE